MQGKSITRVVFFCVLVSVGWTSRVQAQNRYSFLNAAESAIPYTVTTQSPVRSCEELVSRGDHRFSVLSARPVGASGVAKAHCRVNGVIPPEIRFQVNLPATWNGRFYMHGNGGFAGTPPEGEGRAAIRDQALGHGFATAYTDTGHDQRAEPLATFAYHNVQKEIDYAFRAVHLTALTAKELIRHYYGQDPRTSYWDGCSTGGRQGLISAQRFPEDFDGIVVGAPVLNFTGTMLSYVWKNRALRQAPVTPASLDLVAKAVYERCDAMDGLEDGLLEDPRRCDFDPARDLPQCGGEEASRDCVTAAEVETLEKIYGDVVIDGDIFFPGQPLGAEAAGQTSRGSATGWDRWLLARGEPSRSFLFMDTFLKYMAFLEDNADYDWTSFDLEKDPERMERISEMLDATNPDLRRFKSRGGKIVSYFGWADAALNPLMAIDYYERVEAEMGGPVLDFYRMFMVPGMFHCRGGLGVDRLDAMTALVEWVEGGIAPDEIVASRVEEDVVTLSRPLCPYPQIARYDGLGSPKEATSFTCVEPEPGT